jgi:hypothetical protein
VELWPDGPLVLPHEFTVDGHPLTVPEIETSTLVGWLAYGRWWELYPGTIPGDEMMPLTVRWYDDEDPLDYEHLYHVAATLLGRLAGLGGTSGAGDGFWPGRRIAVTALIEWPRYAAWCAAHGRSPVTGPLYEVVGAMYAFLRDRCGGGEALEDLDAQIFAPPPYVSAVGPELVPQWVRDDEARAALASLNERLPGE